LKCYEKKIPFREALAKFIRVRRKCGYSNEVIKSLVIAFCNGWSALSDEIDKVNKKFEKL
jgi:hypothetical protein